jgi:putative heme-binding domain-containing protein
LGALDDQLVRRSIDDPDRAVRVHALKVLAERGSMTSSLPLSELVRGKLSDEDAFVRRAAVDCLGQHPEAANVKPLLKFWQVTPADDDQLIHTTRMALRDHLKLSEVMGAVSGRESKLALLDAERGKLAELCLGIPATMAADVALDYLKASPKSVTSLGSAAYPLMRNVSTARIDDVYLLALSYRQRLAKQKRGDRKEQLGQEQSLLLGLNRAAQERGVTLPDSINKWGKDFVTKMLASKAGSARELGIELAQQMKLRDAHAAIAEIAVTDVGSDIRIEAILACVAIDGPASVGMLNRIMLNQNEEIGLRQRAARALGTVNNEAARTSLLAFLPSAPERLAVEVASSLAKSTTGGEALLRAVSAGKASPQLLQEPLVTSSLHQQKLNKLDERIKRLTTGLPSRDDQVRRLIEDRLTGFNKFKPDSARGKQVFVKNCAVCHRLGGEGAKIGPELDGIGVRGPARIMEDVLDPNRNIDQAFRATTLTTSNGLTLSGLLVREDGKVLVLVDNLGKEQRISVEEIEPGTRQVSAMSPMPANLRDAIPETDFYQLIAYLLEQQPKK